VTSQGLGGEGCRGHGAKP